MQNIAKKRIPISFLKIRLLFNRSNINFDLNLRISIDIKLFSGSSRPQLDSFCESAVQAYQGKLCNAEVSHYPAD